MILIKSVVPAAEVTGISITEERETTFCCCQFQNQCLPFSALKVSRLINADLDLPLFVVVQEWFPGKGQIKSGLLEISFGVHLRDFRTMQEIGMLNCSSHD